MRSQVNLRFTELDYQPTHGDPSGANMLFTQDKTYFIDWDLFMLRPRIWDVAAGMVLFAMTKFTTAFISKPDFSNLTTYLDAYQQVSKLEQLELELLPEVIAYNASVYWLGYTLPALLKLDFRLLDLLPEDDHEHISYWYDMQNISYLRKLLSS